MGTGFDLDTATALASDPGRLGKVSVFVTNSTTGGDRNDLVAVGRFVQQILGVRGVTANEHVAGKVDNTRITKGPGVVAGLRAVSAKAADDAQVVARVLAGSRRACQEAPRRRGPTRKPTGVARGQAHGIAGVPIMRH